MTDRAASEVLGFALVFSLVVASVAIVSVSGLGALQSARDAEQMNNAERAFDVLADNMADVYQRGAPSRGTEISLGDAQLYTAENVTINVTARETGEDPDTVERSIRPIVYRGNQDREITYEGGAVFRTNRDGGLVIEQPPFKLNSNRVYIQLPATRSSTIESTGGSTVLLRTTKQSSQLAIADTGASYDNLYVNVSSPRNELWRDYLEDTALSCDPIQTVNGEEYVECGMSAPELVTVVVHEMAVTIER